MKKILIFITICIIGVSCSLVKKYQRPNTGIPSAFNNNMSSDSAAFKNLTWKSILTDAAMQNLISSSISNNYDLKTAVERIIESRMQVRNAKSGYYPQISLGIDGGTGKLSENTPNGESAAQQGYNWIQNYDLSLALNYEVDLWGKVKNSTRAAIAQLKKEEYVVNAIQLSIIADVAANYINIVTYENQKTVINENIKIREDNLYLLQQMNIHGQVDGLAVKQAESELYSTRAMLPQIDQQIITAKNALSILSGKYYTEISHAIDIFGLSINESIPLCFPVQLLEKRPDVLQAEMDLVSSHANVGVAKSYFYPSLTISAAGGFQSMDISKIIDPKSLIANVVGGLAQPLFYGRQINANYKASQSQELQSLYQYQQSVINAYNDVIQSYQIFEKSKDINDNYKKSYQSAYEGLLMSGQLFKSGYIDYLKLLSIYDIVLNVQLSYVSSQRDRMIEVINVGKAMGLQW